MNINNLVSKYPYRIYRLLMCQKWIENKEKTLLTRYAILYSETDITNDTMQVHVLKAMRHPYIITYKESFMDKRCLCIVMDYADGGDLYTKIANQKKIGKGNSL